MEISRMRLEELEEIVRKILREAHASKKEACEPWMAARVREILQAHGRLLNDEDLQIAVRDGHMGLASLPEA